MKKFFWADRYNLPQATLWGLVGYFIATNEWKLVLVSWLLIFPFSVFKYRENNENK